MEQVITVRIIDKPQTFNGEAVDVLADKLEHEVTVTDPGDDSKLGKAIARGVLAARGDWGPPALIEVPEANATIIGPAFADDGPPLRKYHLDL